LWRGGVQAFTRRLAMPPRRYITLLSALVHASIISTVFVTQLFSPGPLPIPRSVLAFSDALPVQLKDIPLPPPPRGSSAPTEQTSASAAPLDAPRDIAPETGLENMPSTPQTMNTPGVESGVVGGIDLPGQGLRVEPPPPPPPAPQQPMRLHSGMEPPRKIVNVPPRYPATAQMARIEGPVVLDAVIDATGRVTDVRVVRSIRLLDQAAIDAVRQWRFTPTLLNGEPVSILLTVTVRFTLQ
jgi:periplasmic protein TonB